MNRYRAGQPAQLPLRRVEPEQLDFAGDEPDEGMSMLAYMIVAAVLTLAAIGIGFIVGRYFS